MSLLCFVCFFVGLLDYNANPNDNGKSVSYIAALVALSVDQSITSNITSSIESALFSPSVLPSMYPMFRVVSSSTIDVVHEAAMALHVARASVTTRLALKSQELEDVLKKKLYR
jgi:hypothetical protein